KSKKTRPGDATRSAPLTIFEPLLSRKDCKFFSLQVTSKTQFTNKSDHFAPLPHQENNHLIDLAPYLYDFEQTAGALSAVDVLISTDTATPNLAGALGVPVWLLMPDDLIDWRWKMDKPVDYVYETMWYGSMTVIRQRKKHVWDNVIKTISSYLDHINRPVTQDFSINKTL
ncbi:MAG: hypothetical protein AAF403_08240, partial [Pseudomonadota bacterium]